MFVKVLNKRKQSQNYEAIGRVLYGFDSQNHTELSYLGEFLERHEEKNLSLYDVLLGCAYLSNPIVKSELYGTQLSDFIKKADTELAQDNSFEFKLSYLIFLQKVNEDAKAKEIFENIVSTLKFDKDLLLLTWATNKGFVKFEKYMSKAIGSVLENNVFEYDIESVIEDCIFNHNGYLHKESELSYIRLIQKSFNLKKTSFTNRSRFEEISHIKHIGTSRSSKNLETEALKLSDLHYYLISLKISDELLVDGEAKRYLHRLYVKEMEKSFEPNNLLWTKVNRLELYAFTGKYKRINNFSFHNINFNDLKREYYKYFITNFSHFKYSNIKDLVEKEDFIQLISEKTEECKISTYLQDELAKTVIRNSSNVEVIKKYFDLISPNSLSLSEIISLYNANIVDKSAIYAACIGQHRINSCIFDLLEEISDLKDGIDIVVYLFSKMIEEKIDINRSFSSYRIEPFIKSVIAYIANEASLSKPNYNKDLIVFLNDLVLYYGRNNYYEFILKHIDDENFCEALNISEDEKKDICEYLLTKGYLSSSEKSSIEKVLYTEEYIGKRNLKNEIDKNIEYAKSNGKVRYIESIVNSIESNLHFDSEMKTYLLDKMEETKNFEHKGLNNFYISAMKVCLDVGAIEKAEAKKKVLNVVEEYLAIQ